MVEGGFQLRAGLLRDVGRKRSSNQDFVSYFEPTALEELQKSGCIYVVADGVGGAIRGELASEYAVKALLHLYYQSQHLRPAERLAQIIPTIGNEIYTYAQQQGGTQKMATTMVVAIVLGTRLIVANVGDSRAYLIRGGIARQITQDHRQGENRLTRSVGGELNVRVDLFELDLQPGDRILLCSDGFHRYFSSSEIAQIVTEDEPYRVVYRMVEEANRRGGADNIAVAVVEVGNLVDWPEIPQTRYDIQTPLPLEERPTIADPIYWEKQYNYQDTKEKKSRNIQQMLLIYGGLLSAFLLLFCGAYNGATLIFNILSGSERSTSSTVTPSIVPTYTYTPFSPNGYQNSLMQDTSENTNKQHNHTDEIGKCLYKIDPNMDKSYKEVLEKFKMDQSYLSKITKDDGKTTICGMLIHPDNCDKTFQYIIDLDQNDSYKSIDDLPRVIIIPDVVKTVCTEMKGEWIGNQ